ncbi:MAG: rod shape-determining protein MreC [Cyanobacteria bacterium P01_C01_bin.89]
MLSLRRWWLKNWLRIVLIGVSAGAVWGLRQTQGDVLTEIYGWVARPLQGDAPNQSWERDARVLELQQRLAELENQNRSLRSLIDYQSELDDKGIAAPTIGRSANGWWQQVVLGRGSNDGVVEGAIVMAPGGVVGRVEAVTANTSRVLLLSNLSSRVGVTVGRSRFMGYLRGQNGNVAVMEFFEKLPDVRAGDTVFTSNYSQLFPAGLPVGVVESVDTKSGPAPEAKVRITAPLSTLEWTIIYPYTPESLDNLPLTDDNEPALNNQAGDGESEGTGNVGQ